MLDFLRGERGSSRSLGLAPICKASVPRRTLLQETLAKQEAQRLPGRSARFDMPIEPVPQEILCELADAPGSRVLEQEFNDRRKGLDIDEARLAA